jgi:transaldolase
MTLCFSASQALLAAKAGAAYISPFIGRLDDSGSDGLDLIEDIQTIYSNYEWLDTQILAASIRNIYHLQQAAMIGADIATIPAKLLKQLVNHPLTDQGLEIFSHDWKKSGLKI